MARDSYITNFLNMSRAVAAPYIARRYIVCMIAARYVSFHEFKHLDN